MPTRLVVADTGPLNYLVLIETHGLTVTGTLGVLDLAARRGLLDLAATFAKLRATNFRYPPEIMDALLAQHRKEG